MTISVKKIKVYTPLIFWLFQLVIHIIRNIYILIDEPFISIFRNIVFTFPLDIITFCIFYYYFAPKFLAKEKLKLYILLSITFLFLHSYLWAYVYYLRGMLGPKLTGIYVSSIGHTLLYAFYAIVIRLAIDWFQKRDDQKELEKQNIKTELALLRSQINPHFLFNTLNNINSFAISEPDKSSFAIIKLSEIMRYMLYEAKGESVLLEKEINYINNYLDLQRIRYKYKDFIKFDIENVPSNILVPPMLFIPFIENAFKHGQKGGKDKIIIQLKHNQNRLQFLCTNQKRTLNETEENINSGIGIANIKRRLELLYPEKYDLKIIEDQQTYKIELMIELENKVRT